MAIYPNINLIERANRLEKELEIEKAISVALICRINQLDRENTVLRIARLRISEVIIKETPCVYSAKIEHVEIPPVGIRVHVIGQADDF